MNAIISCIWWILSTCRHATLKSIVLVCDYFATCSKPSENTQLIVAIYFSLLFQFDNATTHFISDDVSSRSLSPAEMEAIAERMHSRNERLAEKCNEYGLNVRRNDSLHRPNPWEFLVNKRFHLIWCNVFKAASTSWMYNFNILAGYSPQYLRKTNTVPLELARKRYERVSTVQVIWWKCRGTRERVREVGWFQ